MAKEYPNILFGGRLGQYKYYNMDQVVRAALDMVKEELEGKKILEFRDAFRG